MRHDATQDTVRYTFRVDGQVEKTDTADSDQTIYADGTVAGRVESGQDDAYEINGDITFFETDGPIVLMIDGVTYNPSAFGPALPNHLVIVGEESDSASPYEFTVDGYVVRSILAGDAPVDDILVSVNPDDAINGSTVSGQTFEGGDAYRFNGNITEGTISGGTVYLNGSEYSFPNGNGDGGSGDGTTLTVDGRNVSDTVRYTFRVDGSVRKQSTADPNDSIYPDGTVAGRVEGDQDAYRVDGPIEFLERDGSAPISIDGSRVNPGDVGRDLPNHLVIVGGDDNGGSYEVTVSEYLARSELAGDAPVDDLLVSINDDDLIEGTTVQGRVMSGADAYRFAGDITDHQTTGNISLYENGELIDGNGDGGDQHIVLVGPGSDDETRYYMTVDGSIGKSDEAGDAPIDDKLVSINDDDQLYGRLAQGVLYEGADAYDIEGEILDIRVDGAVTAYLDGEQVDPENLRDRAGSRFLPIPEEVTISPGQSINFLVSTWGDFRRLDLYVDGERVTWDNIESGWWPGPIRAQSWGTETSGTYHVEAIPSDGDDVMATWEVTVREGGNSAPAVTSFSNEGGESLSPGESEEFTVEVEDTDGDLSQVVWYDGFGYNIVDVTQVDGRSDSATVTIEYNDISAGPQFAWVTDESGVQSQWMRIDG